MNWVCIDCGARQASSGKCAACSHDDTLDLGDVNVCELMRDVDARLADRRESRLRFLGVIAGMAIVFGLWAIPGYWSMRGIIYPGLPLLIDQWVLMALIALGIVKGCERVFATKRFPYLRDDLTIDPSSLDVR